MSPCERPRTKPVSVNCARKSTSGFNARAGDYVETIYWTAIEVYVAIIIPCLPAIKGLLCHQFPHIFMLDRTASEGHAYERIDQQNRKKRYMTAGAHIDAGETDLENCEPSQHHDTTPHSGDPPQVGEFRESTMDLVREV